MDKAADRLDDIFAETDRIFAGITDLPFVDTTGVPTDDAEEQTIATWEKLNAQYNAPASEAARIVNESGRNRTKKGL